MILVIRCVGEPSNLPNTDRRGTSIGLFPGGSTRIFPYSPIQGRGRIATAIDPGSSVPTEPIFGNWLVAVAEAAEVAGASTLDGATVDQMARAWDLVQKTVGVTQREMTDAIARQAGIPVARLEEADSRADVLVPAEVAHRRNVLPMDCTDREVTVATANPLSQEAKREIAKLTGRTVLFRLASPAELHEAVVAAYGPADGAEEALSRAETEPPDGPHVLVVDDEVGQRELFRSLLEENGYRVTVAKDGPAAMALMRTDASYHLVTLDYYMDKMNGLRVLQQIRADGATRQVPVIMVTGADDRRIEMSLFEAGADDFISKPIDPALFLLRVKAVLRRRRFP